MYVYVLHVYVIVCVCCDALQAANGGEALSEEGVLAAVVLGQKAQLMWGAEAQRSAQSRATSPEELAELEEMRFSPKALALLFMGMVGGGTQSSVLPHWQAVARTPHCS